MLKLLIRTALQQVALSLAIVFILTEWLRRLDVSRLATAIGHVAATGSLTQAADLIVSGTREGFIFCALLLAKIDVLHEHILCSRFYLFSVMFLYIEFRAYYICVH